MLELRDIRAAAVDAQWGKPAPDRVIRGLYLAARDARRWPEAMALLTAYVGVGPAVMARFDLHLGVGTVVTEAGEAPVMAGADGAIGGLARQIESRRSAAGSASVADIPEVMTIWSGARGEPVHLVLPRPSAGIDGQVAWIGVTVLAAARLEDVALPRLSTLAGHIARALDIAASPGEASRGDASLATVLSALPTAALLVDGEGRVMQANSAALRILGQAGRGTAQGGRTDALVLDDDELALAVRAALKARREGRDQRRFVTRVRQPAGHSPLLVILDPVENPSQTAMPPRSGSVLLRLIEVDQTPGERTYPLQAAFDLTAAEMRVAALIGAGLSPTQAARRLDLSTNTVRTHLARVFDKTGVRSQHALTLLLAAIGSWPAV